MFGALVEKNDTWEKPVTMMTGMAIWVVKFPRKGYKIRQISGQKYIRLRSKVLHFVNRNSAVLRKSANSDVQNQFSMASESF